MAFNKYSRDATQAALLGTHQNCLNEAAKQQQTASYGWSLAAQ